MIAIKSERAELIPVVLAGDRQNRQRDLFELLNCRHHRVVVGVSCRMFQDSLEIHRRISDKRIERFKRNVFLVSVEKFSAPKFLVGEKILLAGVTAGESEPL